MRIGALQKTTLLDFPGKVSAIVFTQGCNFLCPYCHNPDLVLCRNAPLPYADVLGFLAQRRHLLEGVVITGGEPTLHEDLAGFCSILKSLGYAVKLDTNGSRPDVLRRLLDLRLLDYVALDVKSSPRRYPGEIWAGDAGGTVAASLDLLTAGEVRHELRVPCAAPFVNAETFREILEATRWDTPVFLQALRLDHVLDPDFFASQGRALDAEEMELLRQQAERQGRTCFIR